MRDSRRFCVMGQPACRRVQDKKRGTAARGREGAFAIIRVPDTRYGKNP